RDFASAYAHAVGQAPGLHQPIDSGPVNVEKLCSVLDLQGPVVEQSFGRVVVVANANEFHHAALPTASVICGLTGTVTTVGTGGSGGGVRHVRRAIRSIGNRMILSRLFIAKASNHLL